MTVGADCGGSRNARGERGRWRTSSCAAGNGGLSAHLCAHLESAAARLLPLSEEGDARFVLPPFAAADMVRAVMVRSGSEIAENDGRKLARMTH